MPSNHEVHTNILELSSLKTLPHQYWWRPYFGWINYSRCRQYTIERRFYFDQSTSSLVSGPFYTRTRVSHSSIFKLCVTMASQSITFILTSELVGRLLVWFTAKVFLWVFLGLSRLKGDSLHFCFNKTLEFSHVSHRAELLDLLLNRSICIELRFDVYLNPTPCRHISWAASPLALWPFSTCSALFSFCFIYSIAL